jgi:NTE family protein
MNFGRSARENGEPLISVDAGERALPRQVVALAFTAGQIPASFVSERLATSLCAETGSSVVLVRLEPRQGDKGTPDGRLPEPYLNGEFHMPPEMPATAAGFVSLTLGVRSDPPTPAGITSLVSQLSRHFRHVLIQVNVDEHPAPWLFDLLLRSDLAYLFLKPTAKDVHCFDLIAREAPVRCHRRIAIRPIGCMADGESTDGFDLLVHRLASPIHLFVRGTPPASDTLPVDTAKSFRGDVRRIAREISGSLVGLALSSGAAKGFAHIGVIQVLEENGIEVDVIAGASMGAYVGSLWAHGCDGQELERLARELEGRWALWSLVDPAFPPRRGFLRGYAVKKRLMRTLGQERFADLVRPLRVVAANLATLERVVFSSGEVATAVHASIAVPGICVPITVDGETYTDGGIVDPLPVDILREMGISRVIAVNVIPTPDRIRIGIQAELQRKRDGAMNGRKPLKKILRLDRQVNYFARGNLLEILMRSVHGAQIRMAEASCRLADVVLRPEIYDDRWLDYRNPGRFITLGRQVAEQQLEEIKALVARKEASHEREFAPDPMAHVA